jgi:UDP-N-acetylmuramoyl-tripeptide--D-alanyl-D-alanine ligase
MAVRFSDEQVQQATGATRTRIGGRASYDAVCTDSRSVSRGALFVALEGERFDGHEFVQEAAEAGAAGLLVKRGRALKLLNTEVAVYEVDDTLAALGALARFHRLRFKVPVGAVTGSNGKTTTKELIAAILETRGPALKTQGNLNNEVGVPLTLFDLEPRHVAAIIEMGMNHAGEIARLTNIAQPDAGLITVVQPAHLEGLGSIDGVARAKGELFRGLGGLATAVVNLDDERIVRQAKEVKARRLTFGRAERADVRLTKVQTSGRDGLAMTVGYEGRAYDVALRLVGDHNAMNATGAFALALALGYSPEECVRGLESAQAHARRLQLHDAPGGVLVIDDCYNANPASMEAALRTLEQLASGKRAVAVLGDMLELGDDEISAHLRLGNVAAAHASVVAFFGPRSKQAWAEATRTLGGAAVHFEDIDRLNEWLKSELKSGDVVLMKGSRGMRLERAVSAVTGAAAGGAH